MEEDLPEPLVTTDINTYLRVVLNQTDLVKLTDFLKTNSEIQVIFDKIISKSVADSEDVKKYKTVSEKAEYRLKHLLKHLKPDELVDGYVLPR